MSSRPLEPSRAPKARGRTDMDLDTIHLKLDRILAGQEQQRVRIEDLAEISRIQTAAMQVLNERIDIQGETIVRLAEAMSREEEEGGGGDLVAAIASMAASLKQIQQDGARMVVLIGRMPN